MNSIKVCEYSRSRSFHDDLILQDQASGERSQDHWSSGLPCDSEHCSKASEICNANLKIAKLLYNTLYQPLSQKRFCKINSV